MWWCRHLRLALGLAAVLTLSPLARGQCLLVDINFEPGVYEPGDFVSGSITATCGGSRQCGPCLLGIRLDSGCGLSLGTVRVGVLSPASSVEISFTVLLPLETSPGCHRICATPTCPGCFSLCATCCECCPCSNSEITVLPIFADLDGDGEVGIIDFLDLLAAWGRCPGEPDPCPADLDRDEVVGIADFLILLDNWGACD